MLYTDVIVRLLSSMKLTALMYVYILPIKEYKVKKNKKNYSLLIAGKMPFSLVWVSQVVFLIELKL